MAHNRIEFDYVFEGSPDRAVIDISAFLDIGQKLIDGCKLP